jgi:hypothetical protein
MNLYLGDYAAYRHYYGAYLCYTWNRAHRGVDGVRSIELVFLSEMTLPDYARSVPERKTLWVYDCSAPEGVAPSPSLDDTAPSPNYADEAPSPTTGELLPYPTL